MKLIDFKHYVNIQEHWAQDEALRYLPLCKDGSIKDHVLSMLLQNWIHFFIIGLPRPKLLHFIKKESVISCARCLTQVCIYYIHSIPLFIKLITCQKKM